MLMLGFPAFPTQYFSKVGHFAFVTALFGGFPISATEDLSFITNNLDLSMHPSARFPVPGIADYDKSG